MAAGGEKKDDARGNFSGDEVNTYIYMSRRCDMYKSYHTVYGGVIRGVI